MQWDAILKSITSSKNDCLALINGPSIQEVFATGNEALDV